MDSTSLEKESVSVNKGSSAEERGQEDSVHVDGGNESNEAGKNVHVMVTGQNIDSSPAAPTLLHQKKRVNYWKLCEVLLITAVLVVIVGVLMIPSVFYVMWEETQDIVPTCAQVTAYSRDICRDELLSLQTYFSGVTSPPPALNIPSSIDQETGESDAVRLVKDLSILSPSQECREAMIPFLCVSIFNLCDSSNTLHTSLREDCLHIRDDVCAKIWRAVDFFRADVLPVCDDLQDEFIELTNQTMAGPDNRMFANTTDNRLECSSGFHFDNGSSLCLPVCGEWRIFSPSVDVTEGVFVGLCLATSIIMIIVALTVQRNTLLVFPSILVVYVCVTLLFAFGIAIVGFFDNAGLFCKSTNLLDTSQREGTSGTAFCTISGVAFCYGMIQTCMWTVLDAVFFFWAIVFPFSYQQLKLSGRIRIAHIISVLLGLLVPLPAALILLVDGYTHYVTPVLFCIPRNGRNIFYTWLLPITTSIGITTFIQIYIIWTIFKMFAVVFKEFVLKKLLTKMKVSRQIGKVEVKLILLSVHYNLLGIMVMVLFTPFYTGIFIDDITEYFLCESIAGSDCQQHLNYVRTSVILFRVTIIIWSLTPVMSILCKINVFKEMRNCFQKMCAKKQRP